VFFRLSLWWAVGLAVHGLALGYETSLYYALATTMDQKNQSIDTNQSSAGEGEGGLPLVMNGSVYASALCFGAVLNSLLMFKQVETCIVARLDLFMAGGTAAAGLLLVLMGTFGRSSGGGGGGGDGSGSGMVWCLVCFVAYAGIVELLTSVAYAQVATALPHGRFATMFGLNTLAMCCVQAVLQWLVVAVPLRIGGDVATGASPPIFGKYVVLGAVDLMLATAYCVAVLCHDAKASTKPLAEQ
jgi:hypothetical protein